MDRILIELGATKSALLSLRQKHRVLKQQLHTLRKHRRIAETVRKRRYFARKEIAPTEHECIVSTHTLSSWEIDLLQHSGNKEKNRLVSESLGSFESEADVSSENQIVSFAVSECELVKNRRIVVASIGSDCDTNNTDSITTVNFVNRQDDPAVSPPRNNKTSSSSSSSSSSSLSANKSGGSVKIVRIVRDHMREKVLPIQSSMSSDGEVDFDSNNQLDQKPPEQERVQDNYEMEIHAVKTPMSPPQKLIVYPNVSSSSSTTLSSPATAVSVQSLYPQHQNPLESNNVSGMNPVTRKRLSDLLAMTPQNTTPKRAARTPSSNHQNQSKPTAAAVGASAAAANTITPESRPKKVTSLAAMLGSLAGSSATRAINTTPVSSTCNPNASKPPDAARALAQGGSHSCQGRNANTAATRYISRVRGACTCV